MTDMIEQNIEQPIETYVASIEDDNKRIGLFSSPIEYRDNLAFRTNLKELYDIIGVQVTNAWQSFNQPYVIVVEVKEQKLIDLYKGQYLLQIWKKATETSGTLMYEKICIKPPKDFSIRKNLCVYLQDELNEQNQISHNVNIINLDTTSEHKFTNPFSNSDESCAYIDEDILVLGFKKQLIVYETKPLLSEQVYHKKELQINCDNIIDVNFTAMGKSYVLVSTLSNNGSTVQYNIIKIDGPKGSTFTDKQLSTSIFAEFHISIPDEQYVRCIVQPYDYYILLTNKGNFEIYKCEGDKKTKLLFSSYKLLNPDINQSITKIDKIKENRKVIVKEMLQSQVVDIRIVYNFLVIKTSDQYKTYYVQVAKIVDFNPSILKEEFDESILQLALFNPVFFNNHILSVEDLMLSHERFVSIKNIPTGEWQHIQLYEITEGNFRRKTAVMQELLLYKVSDNNIMVANQNDKDGWLIEKKHDGQWVEDKFSLTLLDNGVKDDSFIYNITQLQSNPSIFYIDAKNDILCQRRIFRLDIKKRKNGPSLFIESININTAIKQKFIPIKQQGTSLIFIYYNIEDKKAFLYKEDIKGKNGKEFKLFSQPLKSFTGVDSISATNYKKDSILILMNGQFYEYNLTEGRTITHTKPARGGIDKAPLETEELYILQERFLYFIDCEDNYLYISDLLQFKSGGISIRDFIKIEVCPVYHHQLSIDDENERLVLMKSRFEAWIFPFLHQPRSVVYKVLNNPDNFVISQVYKEKIYALEQSGYISVWNITNSHLVDYIKNEDIDLQNWTYLCQAGQSAVYIQIEVIEEGKQAPKHEDIDHIYQVISMDFSSGQCKLKSNITYTHRHKKFSSIKYNNDFSRMIEQNGKSDIATVYTLDSNKNTWIKKRELQDIKDFQQVSPCITYFYTYKACKFLDIELPPLPKGKQIKDDIDQEDQIEKFQFPIAISSNLLELMIFDNNKFVAILKNNIAKEYEIIGKSIKEVRKFIHHYDDISVTRQYHIKDIVFIQSKDDLIQQLARLNDFYRFQTRYNHVQLSNPNNLHDDFKYKSIFSISDSFHENKSSVNFPFTFYHWSLLEKIATLEIKIQLLQKNVLQELMFIIDPNGESLFSKLSTNYKALKYAYDTINDEFSGIEKINKCIDMVPFIKTLSGKSPLDLAAEKRDAKSCDQLLFILKQSEFDHHQEDMQLFYEKAFEFNLLNIGDYFDSRLFLSDQLGLKVERGGLEVNEEGIALTTTAIGENDQDKVLQETCLADNLQVPVTMKILDIPGVHRFDNEWSKNLLKCLADTPRLEIFENQSIRALLEFKWPSIKSALTWRLFMPYVLFLICFISYSVFLLEYLSMLNNANDLEGLLTKHDEVDISQVCKKVFYSDSEYIYESAKYFNKTSEDMNGYCESIEQDYKDSMFEMKLYQKLLIIAFVAYFFYNELRQMKDGLQLYLSNAWNYVDLMPLALISMVLIFDWDVIVNDNQSGQAFLRFLLSLAVFFLWIKFLYFLRLFRGTSYLISMIIEVTKDMKTFLAIFMITTLAFGNCFYVYNENLGGDSFINNFFNSFTYVYEINLGNFDTETYTKGTTADYASLYVLFFMATVFLMIIMLNLLVAIIGDSYGRINAQAANLMYKGMSDLIFENDYLLTTFQLNSFHDKAGEYLVIAKCEEEIGLAADVDGRLKQAQTLMTVNHTNIFAYVRNMRKDIDEFNAKSDGFQTRTEDIISQTEKEISSLLKTVKSQ